MLFTRQTLHFAGTVRFGALLSAGGKIVFVIPAMVLAAGKSTRMGRTKATLPIGAHDTFLTRIIRTFHEAAVDDVIVVVGGKPRRSSSLLR